MPLASRCPQLPPALVAVVERCLRKRPEDRHAGGAELAAELQFLARSGSFDETRAISKPSTGGSSRTSGSPQIRCCRTSDGASIAYSLNGSGPVLVRVLGWFTHLDMEWEWPALRQIWERLGRTHTVVRYDGRGIGLSSPWPRDFT